MVGHNLLTLSSRLAELHVACQGISSDQLPQICWAAVCRCGLIEGSEVKVNEQSFGAKLTWSEACLQLLLDVHQGTWLWTLFSVTWRYHHSQLMWCKPPAPPCMVQMVSGTPPPSAAASFQCGCYERQIGKFLLNLEGSKDLRKPTKNSILYGCV